MLILAMGLMVCHPVDAQTRILSRPSPAAIHPDWAGDSTVGQDWAFLPLVDDGPYMIGNIRSPRGAIVNRRVYVVRREWTCDSSTKG